jgi:hypothetical protein
MSARQLLEKVAVKLDLPGLSLTDQEQVTLVLDEDILISFIADENDGLTALSIVGEVGPDSSQVVYGLLESSYVQSDLLAGMRLAIEPGKHRLLLILRWESRYADPARVIEQIEAFANAVDAAQVWLKEGSEAAETRATDPRVDLSHGMIRV